MGFARKLPRSGLGLTALCAAGLLSASDPHTDDVSNAEKSPLIDRFEARIANTVNGSARWVDGFFGDARQHPVSPGAFGRLNVLPFFYEYNGVKVKTRFRAHIPLDNINERFSAVIGRGDEDELIANDYGFEGLLPRSVDDDAWLAGFGYKPRWGGRNRFSLGAGVKFDWPPDPYVRVSYRHVYNFDEQNLLRFRQSVFWQNTEDIGGITSIDLERRVTADNLLRWSNWFKASGKTAELRYDTRLALYRNLQDDRGMVIAVAIRGDTGEDVPVRDYGIYGLYRQRMWRDWFYGQVLLGVAGYRENRWPDRELALIAGIGFEIFFSADKDFTDNLEVSLPWTLGGRL